MSSERAVALYRRLLTVYPRRFHDEYGEDMALMFAEQLRDEPTPRVWARCLVDLAITAPTQHLEARRGLDHHEETAMNRPAPTTVPLIFAIAGFGAILLAVVVGTNPIVTATAVLVAVVAGGLAVTSWRHTRPHHDPGDVTAQWWKVLLAGPALIASFLLAAGVASRINGDELPAGWWYAGTFVLLTAALTTVTGLILGGARLTSHRATPVGGS